jgi:hypothetical protein
MKKESQKIQDRAIFKSKIVRLENGNETNKIKKK